MQPLSTRTEHFTDSVIRRMTRVSAKYGAINLSQGYPDFNPPSAILDRLAEVSHENFHQYSITWGAQNFREALAEKQSRLMGRQIDPNTEIVTTCGSTEAMMAAMMTVANPGDKVIVFSPFYENYGADTILSGAEPIYVPLHPPLFNFNVDELESAFRQHPKALILCNPSNPCGKVFTRAELELIADMAEKYDTYVITDEVYEHIVYAPYQHTYFATLPGMWQRTISCSSLSKTYSITGWRLGYTIAPPEITDRIKKVHDFLTVGAAAPLQEAVIPGLRFGQEYYNDLLATYTRKRDLFVEGLDAIGLQHTVPQGAYYILMDISEFGFDSDLEFCEVLARDVGVGAVPGSSFFREPVNHLNPLPLCQAGRNPVCRPEPPGNHPQKSRPESDDLAWAVWQIEIYKRRILMKLFLCSHFSSVGSLIKEEIENKKIAFIPTASLREGYTGYVGSARKLFKKLGAIVTEIDISTEAYSTIQSVFEDADVIYFTGGNSFFLIDQLRKTGTDELLKKELAKGKLMVGESAGAIICAQASNISSKWMKSRRTTHKKMMQGLI